MELTSNRRNIIPTKSKPRCYINTICAQNGLFYFPYKFSGKLICDKLVNIALNKKKNTHTHTLSPIYEQLM